MIDQKIKNEVHELADALCLLVRSADEMREGTFISWLVYHAGYMTNLATKALGGPDKLAICTIDEHDPAGLRLALSTAIVALERMSQEYCEQVADDGSVEASKVIGKYDDKFIQTLRDVLNKEGAGRVKPTA